MTTMFGTKNVLMLVILSAGLLTAITSTGTSLIAPAFAETDDCEDNDDNNCNENERTQRIHQENDCSVENTGNANGGSGDGGGTGGAGGSAGSPSFSCSNSLTEPNTGDDAFSEIVPPT